MGGFLLCVAVGLLGMLLGAAIGLRLGRTEHWGVIHEYRRRIEDPGSYKPAGPGGLMAASDLPDIGPSLAALAAKGELNHVDLVFPNVPYGREVTRYWMQHQIDGIVEIYGNPDYVDFETAGVQPVHINIWFTDDATEQVKELIVGIESFANGGPPPAAVTGAQPGPVRPLADVVASWQDLGMWLPSAEEVALFRDARPQSLDALRVGLQHDDSHVRMSTAYVAEELGSDAAGLAKDMLRRLQSEDDPIVRAYIACALAAVEDDSQGIVDVLRKEFGAEEDEQAKTHVAGALVRLNSPDAEPEAWRWLLDSLKTYPPDPPQGFEERSEFWERRRWAVRHLRETRGKEAVLLPLLTQLAGNAETPDWLIKQQVAGAVEEMKRRTEAPTSP